MQPIGVLIVGAGHAGVECAWALRAAGYTGSILLAGEEVHAPYERPPLSKGLLLGATEPARLQLKAPAQYESQGIMRLAGQAIVSLGDGVARCADGRKIAFERCVLATGSRARRLAGLDGPRVHAIRNQEDALGLRQAIAAGQGLLVLGGGYLGLEAACSAARLGARVTVLEQGPSLMGGRVSPHTSQAMAALHIGAGIDLRLGCRVQRWERMEAGWRAHIDAQQRCEAEHVLVAIGGEPNDSLARQAGLACADGVRVDEHCRTSDARVYAIGDCASAWREELGRHARVESVQNALAQARIAAAHIAGKPPLARRTATFWSEQQGRRLQMAGLVAPGAPCRDVVLSTPKGWIVERHLGDRLAAIEAVDSPAEFVKGVARLSAPPQLQET